MNSSPLPPAKMTLPVTSITPPPLTGCITRQFTVWCGLCPKWTMSGAERQKAFVLEIKANGWKWMGDHYGWCCPECQKSPPNRASS